MKSTEYNFDLDVFQIFSEYFQTLEPGHIYKYAIPAFVTQIWRLKNWFRNVESINSNILPLTI